MPSALALAAGILILAGCGSATSAAGNAGSAPAGSAPAASSVAAKPTAQRPATKPGCRAMEEIYGGARPLGPQATYKQVTAQQVDEIFTAERVKAVPPQYAEVTRALEAACRALVGKQPRDVNHAALYDAESKFLDAEKACWNS